MGGRRRRWSGNGSGSGDGSRRVSVLLLLLLQGVVSVAASETHFCLFWSCNILVEVM